MIVLFLSFYFSYLQFIPDYDRVYRVKMNGNIGGTMGKYFGTDGFRGEAGVNLTVEHAFRVGRFLGYYYGKDHNKDKHCGKYNIQGSCLLFKVSFFFHIHFSVLCICPCGLYEIFSPHNGVLYT